MATDASPSWGSTSWERQRQQQCAGWRSKLHVRRTSACAAVGAAAAAAAAGPTSLGSMRSMAAVRNWCPWRHAAGQARPDGGPSQLPYLNTTLFSKQLPQAHR
jgi:hypothetical protein